MERMDLANNEIGAALITVEALEALSPNIKHASTIGQYLCVDLDLCQESKGGFLARLSEITRAGWLSENDNETKALKKILKKKFLETDEAEKFKQALNKAIEKFFNQEGTVKKAPEEEGYLDKLTRNNLSSSLAISSNSI